MKLPRLLVIGSLAAATTIAALALLGAGCGQRSPAPPAPPAPVATAPAAVEEEPVTLVRPNLVDLPPLPDGWVYAYDADVGYILAHPEGWKFVAESDDAFVRSHSLIDPEADVVVNVHYNLPTRFRGKTDLVLHRRYMAETIAEGKIFQGANEETYEVPPSRILPFDGHANFEGRSFLVAVSDERYYTLTAYSPTNKLAEHKDDIDKIVKSLRVLK